MKIEITGAETADQLIKQLVYLRHSARRWHSLRDSVKVNRNRVLELQKTTPADSAVGAQIKEHLNLCDEHLLQIRFAEIEIGQYLMPLCAALDQKATRQQVFEAINTNPADRDTDEVSKYGESALTLICVLHLENSASVRGEDFASREFQPLQWCHTQALMHAMTTNPKLDRIIHDGANEFFNGAFGEYRERPLMERLAGRAV